MSDGVSIYHTHPAAGPDSRQMSPNFWVGYGRLPHSVQERNVNLTMYRIPARRTMLEGELLDYTYLFVPEAEMDTVAVDGQPPLRPRRRRLLRLHRGRPARTGGG